MLLKVLVKFKSFFMESVESRTIKKIRSFVNKEFSSCPFLVLSLCSFSFLLLYRVFENYVKKRLNSEHHYLFVNLKKIYFSVFFACILLDIGFSHIAFIMLMYVLYIPNVSRMCNHEACLNFSNGFSMSTKWFLFLLLTI